MSDEEDKVEFREHLLIYSGFIAASSLTSIIFLVGFSSLFSTRFANLNIELTVLALACLLSTFAGLAAFISVLKNIQGDPTEGLELFALLGTLFSSVFFISAIPLLVAPISEIASTVVFAGLIILILAFSYVLLSTRS